MNNRKYPLKDLKVLWARSCGHCAFPNCRQPCIVDATEFDEIAIIGKIAHIYAHSDGGPRAKPYLSDKERDCYDNWVILCSTHHDLVDAQYNTYTAEDLIKWKRVLEAWIQTRLVSEMPAVTFAELESIINALSNPPFQPPSTQFNAIHPKEKMDKNNLTDMVHPLITSGLGKFKEVEKYVEHLAVIDSNFPERLKAGFLIEYNKLYDNSYRGDELFGSLHQFACRYSQDFQKQAAGLAVLIYLFHKCEVFES